MRSIAEGDATFAEADDNGRIGTPSYQFTGDRQSEGPLFVCCRSVVFQNRAFQETEIVAFDASTPSPPSDFQQLPEQLAAAVRGSLIERHVPAMSSWGGGDKRPTKRLHVAGHYVCRDLDKFVRGKQEERIAKKAASKDGRPRKWDWSNPDAVRILREVRRLNSKGKSNGEIAQHVKVTKAEKDSLNLRDKLSRNQIPWILKAAEETPR